MFQALVERKEDLNAALEKLGVSPSVFFTALDASGDLRGWLRGVKAAQAMQDIESVKGVLELMEDDASDEEMGNGVRNAKMAAARLKLEQYRWMAQRLLPSLFGEKTQSEVAGKIEIVVRREAKKMVQVEEKGAEEVE